METQLNSQLIIAKKVPIPEKNLEKFEDIQKIIEGLINHWEKGTSLEDLENDLKSFVLNDEFIDIAILLACLYHKKDPKYGASWKRRGDQGVFYTLARKWDRIEEEIKRINYMGEFDKNGNFGKKVFDESESIITTIGDLATYLLMWLTKLRVEQQKGWKDFENEVKEFN